MCVIITPPSITMPKKTRSTGPAEPTYTTFGGYVPESGLLKTILVFICFHLMYLLLPLSIIFGPLSLVIFGGITTKAVGVLLMVAYACTFDGSHKKGGKPWSLPVNLSIVR